MIYYSIAQWLIFFFIYCFFGWIWECIYVSVKKRQWVNRGFLHGPFLPIYGSGAIVILLSTIGVKDNYYLVFLLGMIASTILEFCTGACMERLFGVRYWDYSNLPLNFKGHICLFISLGWGIFSVLLVFFIHKPIESVIMMLPERLSEAVAFALTIYMTADFTISVNEALNLKETLKKFAEENNKIKTYSRRVEIVATFAEDDFLKKKEKFMQNFEKESKVIARIIKNNPTLVSGRYKESMSDIKNFLSKKRK